MDWHEPNESWPKEATEIYCKLNKLTDNGKWIRKRTYFHSEKDFRREFIKAVGNKCFSCAVFSNEEEKIQKGVVVFQEWTEGGGKFVHGGAIATIFGYFLSHLPSLIHKECSAKSLKIEYKRPIPLFSTVLFEGKISKVDGNNIEMFGQLKNMTDGKVYDEAKAVFTAVKSNL